MGRIVPKRPEMIDYIDTDGYFVGKAVMLSGPTTQPMGTPIVKLEDPDPEIDTRLALWPYIVYEIEGFMYDLVDELPSFAISIIIWAAWTIYNLEI